jgi:hypothetical protein
VNYPSSSVSSETACNSILWNGTTYTESGNYQFTTLNSEGCDSIANLQLTITTPSTAATSITSASDSIVIGNSGTLSVSGGQLGSNANWVWYAGACGGTPIGTGVSVSVSPSVPTTYYVRAEGDCNTTLCVAKSIGVIYCNPTGVISNKPNNTICKGSSITMTVNGPINGTAQWKWYKGTCGPSSSSGCSSSSVGIGSSITVAPTSTTTYFVRAEGGPCGITACVSMTVIVNTIPSTPGAITGPVSGICNSATATYSIAAVSGATSYAWTVPTGATIVSGQGTTSIVVAFGTSLGSTSGCSSSSICVKASNTCGVSSSRCVSVSLKPVLSGSISGPSSAVRNQIVVYSVTAVAGVTSYTWTVPSGWVIQSGQGTTSISVKAGASSGTVRVTPQSACGAGTSLSKSVSVGSCNISLNNYAGNSGSVIFPNPTNANSYIDYQMKEAGTLIVDVYSITGQHVINMTMSHDMAGDYSMELPLTEYNLSSGLYFVRLVKDNHQEDLRLVVE